MRKLHDVYGTGHKEALADRELENRGTQMAMD